MKIIHTGDIFHSILLCESRALRRSEVLVCSVEQEGVQHTAVMGVCVCVCVCFALCAMIKPVAKLQ